MYKSLVYCMGIAEVHGDRLELLDTRQEKLSPSQWNPEKCKGLTSFENPRESSPKLLFTCALQDLFP